MLIVSFTTIPSRLDMGLPINTIQSILQQTYKPDVILVNLPEISRKGVPYDKKKAEELEKIDKTIKINWISTDYGPITKLMGTLEYIEKQSLKDVQICLVDDDCKYDPTMLDGLIHAKKDTGGCKAVGYSARTLIIKDGVYKDAVWNGRLPAIFFFQKSLTLDLYDSKPDKKTASTSFLETFSGVLYDADLFLPFNTFSSWYDTLPKDVYNADDIIIGAWINKRGANPRVVRTDIIMGDIDIKSVFTPALFYENIVNGKNDTICEYFIKNGYYMDGYYEEEHTWSQKIKVIHTKYAIYTLLFLLFIFIIVCLILWIVCKYIYNNFILNKKSLSKRINKKVTTRKRT